MTKEHPAATEPGITLLAVHTFLSMTAAPIPFFFLLQENETGTGELFGLYSGIFQQLPNSLFFLPISFAALGITGGEKANSLGSISQALFEHRLQNLHQCVSILNTLGMR